MKSGRRVSHGAAEHCDEETEYRDDDDYTTRPVEEGDRATFGAQRAGASLNCADLDHLSDVEHNSEDEDLDEGSDAYVSSVEDLEGYSEVEGDEAMWQICDSEVAFRKPQSSVSRSNKKQSSQHGDGVLREQQRLTTSDTRVPKKSRDDGYKTSKYVNSRAAKMLDLTNDHSSQSMPARKGRAAGEEVSCRSRASVSEAVVKPARRPMKLMQSDERTSRPIVDDRRKVKFTSTSTVSTKQADRRHSQPLKRDEYYSDSETEVNKIPSKRLNSRRKLRTLKPVSYTHLTLPTNREV